MRTKLVDNGGAVLKQALALAPGIPYIVIAGTPCQDLTTIGKLKGTIGLAGTRSIYFYTFHLTLHYLQEALTPSKVLHVLENAASMEAEYRQTIQLVLGNSGRTPQLRERDSGNHTVAQRKRYYFTNSTHTAEPTQDPTPWELPWTAIEQLTSNAKHRLLPIVRLQGHDPHRGLYRHSHLALHPYSLLYQTTLQSVPPATSSSSTPSGADTYQRAQRTPIASTSPWSSSTPATSRRTPNLTSVRRSYRTSSRIPVCTSPSGHYTMKRHSQQLALPSMSRPDKTSPPSAHHTCASPWRATRSIPSLLLPRSEVTPTSGTT